MPAPDPRAVDAVHPGPVPAVAVLEIADASLTAGAPFHQLPESPRVLGGAADRSRLALARDRHPSDAELVQFLVHHGLAVAAIGGHRPGNPARPGRDPLDRRGQQRRIQWVANLDLLIEHDPVRVVGHLRLVAELDRLADTTFDDRAGVGVVQADQPAGPLGDLASQPHAGLGDDPGSSLDGGVQVADQVSKPPGGAGVGTGERAACVAGDPGGVGDRLLGEAGQLPNGAQDGILGLLAAAPQGLGELVGAAAGSSAAIPGPGAPGPAGGWIRWIVRCSLPMARVSSPASVG